MSVNGITKNNGKMKLHELSIGQRFTFSDKHRGKVFEVTGTTSTIEKVKLIIFQDVATGEVRNAFSNRKTFRMEVELVTDDRTFTMSELLTKIDQMISDAEENAKGLASNKFEVSALCSEAMSQAYKNVRNFLTGSAGRRPNNDEI